MGGPARCATVVTGCVATICVELISVAMTAKSELREDARLRRTRLAAACPDFAARAAKWGAPIPLPPGAPVSLYWPIADEADPRALAGELARHGHPLLLPCVAGRGQPLHFRLWQDGDGLLSRGFNLFEPGPDRPCGVPRVLLVPLLAFDRRGFRLGYGGGYYDRTLEGLRAAGDILAVGIAYAGQEVERLVIEPHDQPLDMVVTEAGVRHFAHPNGETLSGTDTATGGGAG